MYETMLEMIVSSTSSSSDIHGVINDNNNNFYVSIVMVAMWMNQGYLGESSYVDEELTIDVARFFELLKDFDDHNKMYAQIIINYQSFHEYLQSS